MNRSAFRFPNPSLPLVFNGERYVSGLLGNASSGDIQSEHYHRYLFALRYCVDKDVLDVASGEGYGTVCLSQVARSVVGVDASAEAVSFANSNYLTDRVSFKCGRAQELPIESQSVDIVVSFETLEHFAEHELFGEEIRRVLRPGGLLIISSPNRTVYTEQADYHNEFHVRELDREQFLTFLKAHFENVALLSQRPLVGSVISNEDDATSGMAEGFILQENGVFERTKSTPHPPFFLALASDAALPPVHPSMLHNPALLHHLDNLRQQAVNELAQRIEQGDESGHVLAARAEQVAELESILSQRSEQVAELESILSQRGEQIAQLEAALAQRSEQIAALTADLRRAGANQNTSNALRANSQAKVSILRDELNGARRRTEELRSELQAQLSAEQALASSLRAEIEAFAHCHNELIQEKERLSAKLADILKSRSWKVTAPVRRISEKLRSAAASPVPEIAVPEIAASPELLRPAPAAYDVPLLPETPVEPSARFRSENPAWIEPQKRPEFIRLRSMVPAARIAVVLHLYYIDLWQEIAAALLNISEPFDLFVTLVAGASEDIAPSIEAAFPNANILILDNHGRDILPFLELLRSGVLFRYELLCKLHSKRSAWREGGEEWRQHLIRGILGNPETVNQVLRAFDSDADLGMVVADHQLFEGREYWAANEARLMQLFPKIGLTQASFEKSFAGGSIFWIRPLLLRSIEALGLGFDDFEPEPIGNDGTTAHAVERLISLVCHDAGMHIEQTRNLASRLFDERSNSQPQVHLVAHYLPQFHPVPENDAWWGTGFTEWTNVTSAKPQFQNHRQPRLPADLGFYDLRIPEVRQSQADLARQYGITAFSYYYYWFNGQRLLQRPLDEVLASGVPDFPFMICWANEPWTRNWDGLSEEVLMPQDYQPGWEQHFAADIAPLLRDRRYLHLNGRPVLAIYRVMHIPEAPEAMLRLRACLAQEGLPQIHLIGGWLQLGGEVLPAFPEALNLDAYFEFPPHGIPVQNMNIDPAKQVPGFAAHVYDYNATAEATIDQLAAGSEGFRYRGVMTGWDNTARRGRNAHAFHGATPTNFRRWLRATLECARAEALESETAVFINAWNEWAEGSYLEPDRDFGHGWLEAVASVKNRRLLPQTVRQEAPLLSKHELSEFPVLTDV